MSSSSENATSFCVFCYRSSSTNFNKVNKDLIKRFPKFVSRFVLNCKQNKLSKTYEQLLLSSEIPTDNLLNNCEDCELIIESFCEDYHKLKCLEMQLEWKLDKLVRIVKLANLVPSRLSRVNKVLDNIYLLDKESREKSHKSIIKFRRTITKAGQRRQKTSQPRVILTNVNGRNASVLPNPPVIPNNKVIQHENNTFDNECLCEEFFMEVDEQDDVADPLDFETAAQTTENPKDHVQNTVSDVITEEILEANSPISNSSPTPALSIENIILNTCPSNRITEQNLKTEPDHMTTDLTETTQNATNLDNNNIVNLLTEDEPVENVEQKPIRQLFEENQSEKSEPSHDNNTSTSKQQRYSLREKRVPKIEQLDESSSDHDDDNFNDNNYTSSDSSVDEPDKTIPKSRRCRKPSIQTQRDRLKKLGHIMCWSQGCQVRFRTEESYKSHMQLHKPGKYKCQFCPLVKTSLIKLCLHEYKTHSTPENLNKDKNNHTDKKYLKKHFWTCPRCPESFITSSVYLSHFAHTHFGIGQETLEGDTQKSQNSQPFKRGYQRQTMKPEVINGFIRFRCKFCKLPFKERGELGRHIRELHSLESAQACQSKSETSKLLENFKCNFCQSTFEYAPDLAIHETNHAIYKTNTEKMPKQKAVKTSKCPRCPFLYILQGIYVKHHLKVHLKLLSGDYPGACKLCSGPNVYVPNRENHYERFHNTAKLEDPTKVFKCEYEQCSAYFIKASQLYIHTNFIHLTNNHKCHICDKVFKTRRQLMGHLKTRHKNYDEDPSLPLACDRDGCPKRFKSEGELEHHQMFHAHTDRSKAKRTDDNEDESEHICADCGKICKSSELLTSHQKTVHCERSFVCQECGKAFKAKYNLIIHLEYHKSPDEWKWECKECGKKCADKQKLKFHLNTHSKEKPWICEFCGEKYAHRHNWRNHLKTKHGDEEGAQKDIQGKILSGGLHLKRKGTKKGDCIIAGVVVEKTGLAN